MAPPHVQIPFDSLDAADLVVDAVYSGGTSGTSADDPLQRLLPVGNQGGFRYKGSPASGDVRLVVLYTSGHNADWPDALDEQAGIFTYYGDNRTPGHQLHTTPRRGNIILRDAFAACHGDRAARQNIPPFLLFAKAGSTGRAVRFRGLLAPGAVTLSADEDLQAVWRSSGGQRFQNYRARFTVLDVSVVSRQWIVEILQSHHLGSACPQAWANWVNGRAYDALIAPATRSIRNRNDQLPSDPVGRQILQAIHEHFTDRWTDFEACAVQLWRMMAPATGGTTVTRPVRDNGRDAVGVYQLGPAADRVSLDFALEAKCYALDHSVGVRETSRLISRIRHRMFGVLLTTSYLNDQAYSEIREDQHPIVVICGRDIVDTLRAQGYTSVRAVQAWLTSAYPRVSA